MTTSIENLCAGISLSRIFVMFIYWISHLLVINLMDSTCAYLLDIGISLRQSWPDMWEPGFTNPINSSFLATILGDRRWRSSLWWRGCCYGRVRARGECRSAFWGCRYGSPSSRPEWGDPQENSQDLLWRWPSSDGNRPIQHAVDCQGTQANRVEVISL